MGGDVTELTVEVRREMALQAMNEGWARRSRHDWETALLAYQEALAYWLPWPPSFDVNWRNSVGACYLNQGELLLHLRRPDALVVTDEAIACLGPGLTDHWTALRRNLAGAWANRAQIEHQLNQAPFVQWGNSLKQSVCRCLGLVLPYVATAPEAGPLALQALRHGAEAIGAGLPQLPREDQLAWSELARQWIDQGLAIAHGLTPPAPATQELASRLLYIGGQLHALGSPDQLVPFFARHQAFFQRTGHEEVWRTAAGAALTQWEEATQRIQLWDARSAQSQAALANVHRLRAWAKNERLR